MCAVPLEGAAERFDGPLATDPALANVRKLSRIALGNMAGVQFFLNTPVPVVSGHVQFPDAPFALTSISQGQFWNPPPDQRTDAPAGFRDVISVILSDWDSKGSAGIAARDYADRDDLVREVWNQMETALPAGTLNAGSLLEGHLDYNISLHPFANRTPLLVHPLGQRALRPDAQTAIANLFLAADYVRTFTALAPMEGADEAGRRASRAILDACGIPQARWPFVNPLRESPAFLPAKWKDKIAWRFRRPHITRENPVELERYLATRMSPLALRLASPLEEMLAALRRLPPFEQAERDEGALREWQAYLTESNA